MDLKYTLFLFVLIILGMGSVIAPPPVQESIVVQIGIDIESPIIATHIVGQDFKFHIHAHNVSTGLILDNETTSCLMHLYDPIDGRHIIEGDMDFDSNNMDFEYFVLGGNFTRPGQYAVLFYCEAIIEGVGGFFEYGFDVTGEEGFTLTTGMSILYLGLLIIAISLFCLTFYWAIRIKFGNFYDDLGENIISINWLKYLKLFLIPINYVILMFLFGLSRSIAANYLQIAGLERFFNWAYWIMMSMAYPLAIFGLYLLIIVMITDKKIINALKRGDPTRL